MTTLKITKGMPRPYQFPNCMALSSKTEPCVGYAEIFTRLDLAEKDNERLRALLERCLKSVMRGKWRDSAGLSAEAHLVWDDVRAQLSSH